MQQALAYLNGELVPGDQAVLPVSDAGIVQGATVSETMRTFGHQLFRLDEHLERFTDSLAMVGFELDLDFAGLSGVCQDLVSHNSITIDTENDLGLVLFATAGPYATYSGNVAGTTETRPTVCAHTFPLPFELWDQVQTEGLHLVTPSVRQLPGACIDPSIKHRSRLHYYLADREAKRIDSGARAVLLDDQGRLTETTAASLLLVRDNRILSPPSTSVLPSISVAVIAELAGQLDLEFIEQDLRPDDVVQAAEALVASTPYCLAPVTRFNDQPVGSGRPGPISDRLLGAWDQLVGLDIRKQIREGAESRRGALVPLGEPGEQQA